MFTKDSLTLDDLFAIHGFKPNEGQREAIFSLEGPLFLMAGPGSGKTRVLLWRTVNAIVFQNVLPERVFLSTFTEKAAKQIIDGLQTILGTVTNLTGVPYDISRMYMGTVHSLCQKIISDRRFIKNRSRIKPPILMDELDQYYFINSSSFWKLIEDLLHVKEDEWRSDMKQYFGKRSESRHDTALSIISIFNRFSEENLPIETIKRHATNKQDEILLQIAKLYEWYKKKLNSNNMVDFSLLQQRALHQLLESEHVISEFEHVVIDEFQDTNRIQEQLFFRLAKGNKNLCVVGDDDQALYRFRGATVENFVQFPQRSQLYLQTPPKEIKLNINYRSKKQIVSTYTNFIDKVSWVRENGDGYYRLHDKDIQAFKQDNDISVITTTPSKSEDVAEEIAQFVKKLIDEKKVEDPNQIAFLFPALKNNQHVKRTKRALEKEGIKVYAPRAGRFLEVEEAKAMFGIFTKVIGRPARQDFSGAYKDYHDWLDVIESEAKELIQKDEKLERFIAVKTEELKRCKEDYIRLLKVVNDNGWTLKDNYIPQSHKRILSKTPLISQHTIRGLGSNRLDKIIEQRNKEGKPFSLQYILNRATSVDWNVLDLFYRLCGFPYFSQMFKLAEDGLDEGPICNLSMISEYLSRYMEQSASVITGSRLIEDHLANDLFGRYVYGLFRLGETEVENDETPFPKGRVAFLTIHQSKGLEFPYVILGNPGKKNQNVPREEEIVRPLIDGDNEPLERIPEFDTMRLFYVALSRAEEMLIISHLRGAGQKVEPAFKQLIEEMKYPQIPNVVVSDMPKVEAKEAEIPKVYSYTSDYLMYLKCPRNYMVFKKYGFVPSRSQTMLFGSLVHQTIEDIHNQIISLRGDRNE
ncbi:ATP-dependent helicase [Bacillus subtilis]|uniref:ATP-dependent helicase n=1 Tax=Bacillus subtilis TaxID=1423 RepID=UPI0002C4F258|nr:ATP-dependent helicase [Bacillus subtilis]AGI31181.1 ATP-dependent DNA helicase [Bacillus subtilis subsp. subtilis str. BAB-1]AKD37238.1 ATP-dependent DNA helicase [Bacillus subtilis HJ5]ALS83882.1 ATP-dependent DNA helicase [Bacillus subtilis subsp. subtilis]ASK26091.1 ATP-dependent DNA helicase [Bacillus subtilis]MCL9627632.1 ATP-dependent helicase [Bacillus subtilis]